jgi:hypothetical protein
MLQAQFLDAIVHFLAMEVEGAKRFELHWVSWFQRYHFAILPNVNWCAVHPRSFPGNFGGPPRGSTYSSCEIFGRLLPEL